MTYSTSKTSTSKKYILFFDINGTILLGDSSAGKSIKDDIIITLCHNIIGKVTNDDWKFDEIATCNFIQHDKLALSHLSYYEYIRRKYPLIQNFNLSIEENKKRNEGIKEVRRNFYRAMEHNQMVPDFNINIARIQERINQEPFLLGSFNEVVTRMQKNISICFRTFGGDMDIVQKYFNDLCDGKHPLYSYFRNEKLKLIGENIGRFYRYGDTSNDTYLAMGISSELGNKTLDQLLNYCFEHPDVKLFHGFKNINNYIEECHHNNITLGLRDYYPYWMTNREHYRTGKVMILNPHSSIERMFFDDNLSINEYFQEKKSIVDLRNADGSDVQNILEYYDKNLIAVNTMKAICEKNYFLKYLK